MDLSFGECQILQRWALANVVDALASSPYWFMPNVRYPTHGAYDLGRIVIAVGMLQALNSSASLCALAHRRPALLSG